MYPPVQLLYANKNKVPDTKSSVSISLQWITSEKKVSELILEVLILSKAHILWYDSFSKVIFSVSLFPFYRGKENEFIGLLVFKEHRVSDKSRSY
jgi:hypothetical protein